MAESLINRQYPAVNTQYFSNADADAFVQPGFYHVGLTTHSPTTDVAYGILCVWTGSGGYITQMYIGHKGTYARYKANSSSNFNAWYNLGNNYVRINQPYEIENENLVNAIYTSDNYIIVRGNIAYWSVRFQVKANTSGSTLALRFKDEYEWLKPWNYYNGNGVVGTVHETWNNNTSGLLFFNNEYKIGVGGGLVANKTYIGTGMYFIN